MIASILMTLIGVGFGAVASFVAGQHSQAIAGFDRKITFSVTSSQPDPSQTGQSLRLYKHQQPQTAALRKGPERDRIVASILNGTLREGALEAKAKTVPFPATENVATLSVDDVSKATAGLVPKPRVVVVFDDVGLDKHAFERLMALPGPLTLSFLPYAAGVQSLVDRSIERGDAAMLHLPMEPVGPQDPGPNALHTDSSRAELKERLAWNLNRFAGFSGVNNHMGSHFTASRDGMGQVLRTLRSRGLFFLDSLTTPQSVASAVGQDLNMTVIRRDVFLDPEAGSETVKAQLQHVEEIARRTGYVIAIAHPRKETIDVIGPWLTSAQLRGFELITIDDLLAPIHRPLRAEFGHESDLRQGYVAIR